MSYEAVIEPPDASDESPVQLFNEIVSRNITAVDPRNHYLYSAPMDRNLEEYSDGFGFDIDLLSGFKVLDLGTGQHGRFVYEARNAGVDAVGVNPAWIDPDYYMWRDPPYHWHEDWPRAIAVAENLPFKSESFHFVFSLWGVPAYLPVTWEAHHQAYQEIHRVLQIGGIALLHPLPARTAAQPIYKELLDSAVGTDYRILKKGIPPKLMITKGVGEGNILVDEITLAADRMTESSLI